MEINEPAPRTLAREGVEKAGAAMLTEIDRFCHPGRAGALARTKVEEAVMWAVKAINDA